MPFVHLSLVCLIKIAYPRPNKADTPATSSYTVDNQCDLLCCPLIFIKFSSNKVTGLFDGVVYVFQKLMQHLHLFQKLMQYLCFDGF